MAKMDAVIMAGAPAEPGLAAREGVAIRAMVRIGDRTMLQRVVDALRGSEAIARIAAVGSVEAEGLDIVVEPGGNLVENVKRGIESVGASEHVLISSSDIPLLTSQAVDDFVARAVRLNADMAYPILPRAHCEKRYPGLKRTYVRTADGVFTGGNLMLVRPDFVFRNWQTIAEAYAARKQVFRLARMIGLGVLVRVLAARVFPGVLKVSSLEKAASRMLDARVAAVVSAYPEIGEDVDKLSDLDAVRRILDSSDEG